jgi:hypothetical protein
MASRQRTRAPASRDEDRIIAQYTQMLAVWRTSPLEFDMHELEEHIRRQTKNDAVAGCRWIVAVRRAQRAGHFTERQADVIVDGIGGSVADAAMDRDPVYHDLTTQLRAIWKAARRKEQRRPNAPARTVTRDEADLIQRRINRSEELRAETLASLGEGELARFLLERRTEYRKRWFDSISNMEPDPPTEPVGWCVVYPSPDSLMPSPVRAPRVRASEQKYAKKIAARVRQWELASRDDDEIAEDPDPFSFVEIIDVIDLATSESHNNKKGEGDLWIASIQRARVLGWLDTDFSYVVLDLVAQAMVTEDCAADPVLRGIEEQLSEVSALHGIEDGGEHCDDPADPPGDWAELRRARERRLAIFKCRVLRGLGEEEMVRLMEDSLDEYVARLNAAAEEGGAFW